MFFQDAFASHIPLYYTNSRSEFCISTSLKNILSQNIIKRKLNWTAVRDFLIAKYIVPNRNTFIKGIFKLPPHRYILINSIKGSVKIKSIYYPDKKVPLNYAKIHLIKTLKDSILSVHRQLKDKIRVCSISSGFDSNIILYYLSKVADKILAITIGGKQINELGNAKKLTGQYENVDHACSVVDDNKLDHFPDIVWQTEGYVFENGLFLQYELASQLYKKGVSTLICGEAADQILDQYRKLSRIYIYNDLKTYIRQKIFGEIYPNKHRESKFVKYIRRPGLRIKYDIELDYIIKKNGILLNSFGIQSFYPFINRKMIEISTVLRKLNSEKAFYKQEVKNILDEKKVKFIEKIGGCTDIIYLFEGYNEIISDLFKKSFFKRLIGKKKTAKILNMILPQRKYEMILRFLYIFLFNELFISGKFDSKFYNINFQATLRDFVKQ